MISSLFPKRFFCLYLLLIVFRSLLLIVFKTWPAISPRGHLPRSDQLLKLSEPLESLHQRVMSRITSPECAHARMCIRFHLYMWHLTCYCVCVCSHFLSSWAPRVPTLTHTAKQNTVMPSYISLMHAFEHVYVAACVFFLQRLSLWLYSNCVCVSTLNATSLFHACNCGPNAGAPFFVAGFFLRTLRGQPTGGGSLNTTLAILPQGKALFFIYYHFLPRSLAGLDLSQCLMRCGMLESIFCWCPTWVYVPRFGVSIPLQGFQE